MNNRKVFNISSFTLVEVLIALFLLSIIALAIGSIKIFSNYQLYSAGRRADTQNSISYCIDHITKEASRVVGNEAVMGANNLVSVIASTRVSFYVDADGDGRNSAADHWAFYRLFGNQLLYCPNAASAGGNCSVAEETLSDKIITFTPVKQANFSTGNFVQLTMVGRWNPAAAASQDNPQMTMHVAIGLPSVSTN